MSPRILVLLAALAAALFAGAAVGGCFQELDPDAASGPGLGADDGGAADALTTWQLCASPACDLPSGQIPFLDQTPPIYLADGSTTTDPCVEVEQASIAVRQKYCAQCHEGSGAQGGFGFVLDDTQLVSSVSQTATADGGAQKLVVPGAPLRSALYASVAQGLSGSASGMPPLTLAGYASIPRPTASDLSVLYAWITACFAGTDAGAYALSSGNYPVDDGGPALASDGGAD